MNEEEMIKGGMRTIVQIRGDIKTVLGEEVFYRLYEIRRGAFKSYAINVSCGSENEMYTFGNERRSAIETYQTIVEGEVTPCTLCDIAHDFNYAVRSSGKKGSGGIKGV